METKKKQRMSSPEGEASLGSQGGTKNKEKKKGEGRILLKRTLLFYLMMLLLYLYFMMANLSMAPKFVYTQF